MHTAAQVTSELKRRGELNEPAPGLVVLRGDAARLRRAIEAELSDLAAAETLEEWHAAPAIPFATLARADYFASFPQWLTAAAHLGASDDTLAGIAGARDASAAALDALRPTATALQPAACYHVYAALADSIVLEPRCCTIAGTCWRHEPADFAPLERGWSFTMREIVRVADAASIAEFRMRGMASGVGLARRLGLRPRLAEASDPFFAPSTRGRALLQRVKALKHELLLPLGDGRSIAAASFNDHAEFFGSAFGIRLPSGAPAATGCVAFGVERWVLAVLVEHGPDARNWPVGMTAGADTAWTNTYAAGGRVR